MFILDGKTQAGCHFSYSFQLALKLNFNCSLQLHCPTAVHYTVDNIRIKIECKLLTAEQFMLSIKLHLIFKHYNKAINKIGIPVYLPTCNAPTF